MTTNGEMLAARGLTEFLVAKDQYRGSSSHLEQRVQVEIKAMAQRIAADVVAENPELAGIIRTMAQQTVAAALRDDAWLSETVVTAVARAMQRHLTGDEP